MATNLVERKFTVTIAGSKYELYPIELPPRGRLHKLIVKQSAGTNAAATIDLFDGPGASGQTAAGEYSGTYTPAATADNYRIIDQQALTSGNPLKVRDTGGYVYQNSEFTKWSDEGDYRRIWLVIAPTSASGSTSWLVSIAVTEDLGT